MMTIVERFRLAQNNSGAISKDLKTQVARQSICMLRCGIVYTAAGAGYLNSVAGLW